MIAATTSPVVPAARRADLRFGVVSDGTTLAAWQARALKELLAVPGVEPVLLILTPDHGRPAAAHDAGKKSALWSAFGGYVAWRSRASRTVDIASVLPGVAQVVEDADGKARRAIETAEPDFLLQFSSDVPQDCVGRRSWDIWSFRSATCLEHDALRPGFSEILDGAAVTVMELWSRNRSDDAVTCLGTVCLRTRDHSYVRTLDDALFGAAVLPARACRRIIAGAATVDARVASNEIATVRGAATGIDVLRLVGRLSMNFVRGQLRSLLLSPQWNVGIVDEPIHRFLEPDFIPRVRWSASLPRSRFVADPFGLPDGSRPEWLVESYDYGTRLGHITSIDPNDAKASSGAVLDVDGHASYPYLLCHDGEIYCVPQLEASRGIQMFRAVQYPTRWDHAGVLIPDVVARDPTVFQHAGSWWVAFTDPTSPASNLHVWWAEKLFGPWQPHAANPVKVDVRSARPAGTPFVWEGKLYRPAQDSSRSYGSAVAICRVDVLTPIEFREHVVRVIPSLPGRYRHGTHTLATVGDLTLVDGKRFVLTLDGTRAALSARLSRRR